jgi:hypothetical protein
MKNIFKLCVVAVMVVLAASCNRKVEFEHTTFATFGAVKYNVPENIEKLSIPVILYNSTGAADVTVSVNANTAVEDTDFEIVSPANGLLSFSEGVDTPYVEVAINAMEGEFTGAKDFSLTLASATEGVSVGNFNKATVTITDLDHPLSAFVGNWNGTLTFASDPPEAMPTTLQIETVDTDETYTKLTISGLEPAYAAYVTGPLEAVFDKETNILTIPAGQLGMYVNSNYDFIFIGLDESWSSIINPRFIYSETDKTLTQLDPFGVLDNNTGKLYSVYQPGAVFTKE